jgi:hypothetical protein
MDEMGGKARMEELFSWYNSIVFPSTIRRPTLFPATVHKNINTDIACLLTAFRINSDTATPAQPL